MSTIAWLDQRAAGICAHREGIPTSQGARLIAEALAARFPELSRETLGAMLMTYGALLSDAWSQFERMGESPQQILMLLTCLTDTAGEYLYAPEDRVS